MRSETPASSDENELLVHRGDRLVNALLLLKSPDTSSIIGEDGKEYLYACRERWNVEQLSVSLRKLAAMRAPLLASSVTFCGLLLTMFLWVTINVSSLAMNEIGDDFSLATETMNEMRTRSGRAAYAQGSAALEERGIKRISEVVYQARWGTDNIGEFYRFEPTTTNLYASDSILCCNQVEFVHRENVLAYTKLIIPIISDETNYILIRQIPSGVNPSKVFRPSEAGSRDAYLSTDVFGGVEVAYQNERLRSKLIFELIYVSIFFFLVAVSISFIVYSVIARFVRKPIVENLEEIMQLEQQTASPGL